MEEHSNRRPDEEGIKTHLPDRAFELSLIPTADLMKKGLRLDAIEFAVREQDSNRRPDEEGIKTLLHDLDGLLRIFQPQT